VKRAAKAHEDLTIVLPASTCDIGHKGRVRVHLLIERCIERCVDASGWRYDVAMAVIIDSLRFIRLSARSQEVIAVEKRAVYCASCDVRGQFKTGKICTVEKWKVCEVRSEPAI